MLLRSLRKFTERLGTNHAVQEDKELQGKGHLAKQGVLMNSKRERRTKVRRDRRCIKASFGC